MIKIKVNKKDLLTWKKYNLTRLKKKKAENSKVILKVEDNLSVIIQGVIMKFDCLCYIKGIVEMPFQLWEKIIKSLKFVKSEEIIIESSTGYILLNDISFTGDVICISEETVDLGDIPSNASEADIILFTFTDDYKKILSSQLRETINEAMKNILKTIKKILPHLEKYGFTAADMADVIANKIGVKNKEKFIEYIKDLEKTK